MIVIKDELSRPVSTGPTEYECAVHAVQEIKRTLDATKALKNGDYHKFGELMNDSHKTLKYVYYIDINMCSFLFQRIVSS